MFREKILPGTVVKAALNQFRRDFVCQIQSFLWKRSHCFHWECVENIATIFDFFVFYMLQSDTAKVSLQVESHTRLFPFDHGINVKPSARFPSLRNIPRGSNVDGTLIEERAWQMILFNSTCRNQRPALFLATQTVQSKLIDCSSTNASMRTTNCSPDSHSNAYSDDVVIHKIADMLRRKCVNPSMSCVLDQLSSLEIIRFTLISSQFFWTVRMIGAEAFKDVQACKETHIWMIEFSSEWW